MVCLFSPAFFLFTDARTGGIIFSMIFSTDSTIRFSLERGFSESFYITCPVCLNSGIKIIRWEDGVEESLGCATCRRRDGAMEPREPGLQDKNE
jgi:hypothetical protein